MPHNRGSLVEIYNSDRCAWELARCRWTSAGTVGGERRLAMQVMRLPRRSRKPTRPTKSSTNRPTQDEAGVKKAESAGVTPPAAATSAATSASSVVAQLVVAYVRPRAAAAPLSSELRAALHLKVASADTLLYSSHQCSPRNGCAPVVSTDGVHDALRAASCEGWHRPPGQRGACRCDTDELSDCDSSRSPKGLIDNASMETAPFFPSARRPDRVRSPSPQAHTTVVPGDTCSLHGQGVAPRAVVDRWGEVLELEVVGALHPPAHKAPAPQAAKAKATRPRHARSDSQNSSFASLSETDDTQQARRPHSGPSLVRTSAARNTPSQASRNRRRQELGHAHGLGAKTTAGANAASLATTRSAGTFAGGGSLSTTAAGKTKPRWRQRVLGWLRLDKASAPVPSPASTPKATDDDYPSRTPHAARHYETSPSSLSEPHGVLDDTPQPPTTSTTTGNRARHNVRHSHATTSTSYSDLQFLQKRVAAVAPPTPTTASPQPTNEFPSAQCWTTLRLRCRHQRHLFQLLHTYVVQCRRARVDVERQTIAEQRHRDVLCSLQSTPESRPLMSMSAPSPGVASSLAVGSPTSLHSSARCHTENWMLNTREVRPVDWPPYVEHLTDPRNDLRFGRIPPFLWFALSKWSTTALYSFERGYLILSHQHYATRFARETVHRRMQGKAGLDGRESSMTTTGTTKPGIEESASAVLGPVHAISSKSSAVKAGRRGRHSHLDTVTLVVSPPEPFSKRNLTQSPLPTPRSGQSALPSPHGYPLGSTPTTEEPSPRRDHLGSTEAGADICTSFRDCFIALLESHVVFMDSFGDVKFHCSMDEMEAITYSQSVFQNGTTSGGKTSTTGRNVPSTPADSSAAHDVPPFYPFLCFHVKGGADEEEEPPMSATFTFLPLIPASVVTTPDGSMTHALGSPLSPDIDDTDGSPFSSAVPEGAVGGADANFTSQHAFGDEHHEPESPAETAHLDWHHHDHLCRRQSTFLDAFLALTSRTIVSETLDQYLQESCDPTGPSSPLGVMSPLYDTWLSSSRPAQPPLHMVELSEKDLKVILPTSYQPPRNLQASVATSTTTPTQAPLQASARGGSGGHMGRDRRDSTSVPADAEKDPVLPLFLPSHLGTAESLELLPLSLRLARHPLPLLLEKGDLFLQPIGAEEDKDTGDHSGDNGSHEGAHPPPADGGTFTPQAPQKRRSQLKRGTGFSSF